MSEAAEVIDLGQRLPTEAEIKSAAEAAEAIARACEKNSGQLPFLDEAGQQVHLSPALCELVIDVLGHVTKGEMVTVVATGALLSTQQAADMLNVSRPFVSRLLKADEMNFIQVGTHRRIKLEDLMEYKRKRDQGRREAIDEIVGIGQELEEN